VNAGSAWPSHFDTCAMFLPPASSRDAQVWRNVWKPIHGTPAAFAAGANTRRRRLPSDRREPVRVANRGLPQTRSPRVGVRTLAPDPHVPPGLPRRAVLQSLAGPHLTIPPGVDLTSPAQPTAAAEAVLAYREAQRKD